MLRWLPLLALVGCIFEDVKDSGTPSTGVVEPPTGTATGSATGSGGTGSATGGTGTGTGGTDATAAMCARWSADRANLSEGTWTGSVASCDPGTLSQDAIDNTVRVVNLYRWLADLDPVSADPSKNADAQACGLMMDANNALSHSPPTSWSCYTSQGASGAGSSNIATTPSVTAVDLYMTDYGNADTLGHRRWILSNWIGPIGVGGTSDYSCLHVIGGSGTPGPDWTAFPSPGPFPLEAMTYGGWASVDDEGWSVQSDAISLSGAQVSITRNGQSMPVTTSTLPGNYGSSYALSIRPSGWESTPGTYHVEVTGISTPITYDVELVDCP